MKLKPTLLILFLFLAVNSYTQEWVKTELTDFISIAFPNESEVNQVQKTTVYSTDDEFAYYFVSISKISDEQSAGITNENLYELYNGVADGNSSAANAEIVTTKKILLQDFPALEIELLAPEQPKLPSRRFKRIVYINQSIISIEFWPFNSEKEGTIESKMKFFNSFLIDTKKVENISSNNSNTGLINSAAYKIGFIIGQVLFYIFLIAVIVGVILLIRYLIKKNKTKEPKFSGRMETTFKVENRSCENCNTEYSGNLKYCLKCGYQLNKNDT